MVAIVRSAEWKLTSEPGETDHLVREALRELSFDPEGADGVIRGHSKTAWLKNRWSATVEASITSGEPGSIVTWRIDMYGNAHYKLLAEVAEKVGDQYFDDRGLKAAIDRMHKASKLFGRKEIRHVRNLLYATESVIELGQGVYDNKQGIIVLTSERLFFLEKSIANETMEEFALPAIHSIGVRKKLGGERLVIHTAGHESEIKQLMHGQADAIVRAFRSLKTQENQPASSSEPQRESTDPVAQIEQLSALHDKGVLSTEEFDAKKAELLKRL